MLLLLLLLIYFLFNPSKHNLMLNEIAKPMLKWIWVSSTDNVWALHYPVENPHPVLFLMCSLSWRAEPHSPEILLSTEHWLLLFLFKLCLVLFRSGDAEHPWKKKLSSELKPHYLPCKHFYCLHWEHKTSPQHLLGNHLLPKTLQM